MGGPSRTRAALLCSILSLLLMVSAIPISQVELLMSTFRIPRRLLLELLNLSLLLELLKPPQQQNKYNKLQKQLD
jgi:hypothetical protein